MEKRKMTAREFLRQGQWVNEEIESKTRQLNTLWDYSASPGGYRGGEHVVVSRKTDGMENRVLKVMEAEEELQQYVERLVELRMEIGKVINQVEDPIKRLILEKKYLFFMSWKSIKEEMGRSIRWMQKKHGEALEEVQEILDI